MEILITYMYLGDVRKLYGICIAVSMHSQSFLYHETYGLKLYSNHKNLKKIY